MISSNHPYITINIFGDNILLIIIYIYTNLNKYRLLLYYLSLISHLYLVIEITKASTRSSHPRPGNFCGTGGTRSEKHKVLGFET